MEHYSSRTQNTAKNIIWGYVGNMLSLLVQFVSRTVFIYTIGVSYLGINGLFSSVLGMLSLSELGIGTAINFSLYKPVAEGDREKVKSLMALYRTAYRVIALVIALIGLLLLPFLPYLINGADNIPNISFYYLIFLFNTVSSYFISYKYGLVNAEQKGYIINNLNSIFTVIITIGQIVVLLLFKNYLAYLVVQAILQLGQKIYIGFYLDKRYSYLRDKNIKPLSKSETDSIKKNVFALMIHKIGEISIYQTDNIIISMFINVTLVGMVSNYNLIITSVTTFITIIFNSVTSSIGNLIAVETKEKQLEIFNIYNFIGFWLYGFTCICFWVLFQPFIELWIGSANLIDEQSLALIIISQYLTGQRLTVNNMKTAGGIFDQDKYISLCQGLINLVVSLVMVQLCGLAGVYIGTVVSGLFANIVRPIIVYRHMFNVSARNYFLKFSIYLLVTCTTGVLLKIVSASVVHQVTWGRFIMMLLICVVTINIGFFAIFFKSTEFAGVVQRVKSIIQKRPRK